MHLVVSSGCRVWPPPYETLKIEIYEQYKQYRYHPRCLQLCRHTNPGAGYAGSATAAGSNPRQSGH
jgi:hypothetical protein